LSIRDGFVTAALRFILQNEVISTVIPGMRRITHVEENLAVSDGIKLNSELYKKLKTFRWDRNPLVLRPKSTFAVSASF